MIAGVRWTLWLAAVGLPLGFGTRLLLARAGPQVIGDFGALLLYIRFVATFLFFGGNAVAIRFLPCVAPARRRSFLSTYAAIVLLAFLPWLVLAAAWPRGLHYLLGDLGGPELERRLLWLAPIAIVFSLLTAALKALLRIREAQLLARLVTAGSFVAYVGLFFWARSALVTHTVALLWGVYFALAAAGAAGALRMLLRAMPRSAPGQPRWFLPAGFWPYTLGLQGNSAITFLSTQLDLILVLQWGGVRPLGMYIALMTLVAMTPTLLDVLLDSLLPALTNALASGGDRAADELAMTFGRLLFPCAFALATLLELFAAPLVRLFGSAYLGLVPWVRLAAPLAAIASASHLFGTLFSATGQPERLIGAHAGRVALFCCLFPMLWARWQLGGAVLTWIAAELTFHFIALWQMRRLQVRCALRGGYQSMALGLLVAAAIGQAEPALPFGACLTVWSLLVASFLLAARYQPAELRALARLLAPGTPSVQR